MQKVTKDKCLEIIDKFEPSKEGRRKGHLGIDGKFGFLFCSFSVCLIIPALFSTFFFSRGLSSTCDCSMMFVDLYHYIKILRAKFCEFSMVIVILYCYIGILHGRVCNFNMIFHSFISLYRNSPW